MHCPGGNATDPIWRVLAPSLGISSWTLVKPQHSNPTPNPNPLAYQLWCSDFFTLPTPLIIPHRLSALLESLMPLQNWCSIYARCSKSSVKYSIRFCGIFPSLKHNFLHIVLLKCPHVQIAFLKFTICDNQALVGCIPILAVAVHLNLKSQKLVSHLIRCIAITYWIPESTTILNGCTKKSGNLLNAQRTHTHTHTHIYIYIGKITAQYVLNKKMQNNIIFHLSIKTKQGSHRPTLH